MLFTEWNWDDALAVRFDEGREEERISIARNALAKNTSLEFVSDITGLDVDTLKELQTERKI